MLLDRRRSTGAENTSGGKDLRSGLEEVLRRSGLTDHPEEFGNGIHDWRCEHPNRYGRCSYFSELIDDLIPVVKKHEAAALRRTTLSGYFGTNAQSTLLRLAEDLEKATGSEETNNPA